MRNIFLKRAIVTLLIASWCMQPVMAVEVSNWTDLSKAVTNNESTVSLNGTINAGPTTIQVPIVNNTDLSGGIIDGNSNHQLFFNYGDLTLNTTIQNAVAGNGNTAGSVLQNNGTLTIGSNAVIQNNTNNYWGGAIHQEMGTTNILSGARFLNNTTSGDYGYGGAINMQAGTLTIADGNASIFTLFERNSAKSGGAIFNKLNEYQIVAYEKYNPAYGGNTTTTVGNYTQFKENKATGGDGGGAIQNQSVLVIKDHVLFEGNTANGGGAISNIAVSGVLSDGTPYSNANYLSLTIGDYVTFKSNESIWAGALYSTGGSVTIGKNAQFNGNKSQLYGGAVTNLGMMSIGEGSVFENNTAVSGGAIANSGNLVINRKAQFKNNTATNNINGGGALVNTKDSSFSGDVSFGELIGTTNVITNITGASNGNSAVSHGGAIYNNGANAVVDMTQGQAVFAGNKSTGAQGGAVANMEGGTVKIGDNAIFAYNSAANAGGAVSTATNDASITSTKTTIGNNAWFVGNTSDAQGGAIHNQRTTTEIGNNAKFYNNTAGSYAGGAIYQETSANMPQAKFTIGSGAEFSGNSSNTSHGGAIFNFNAGGGTTFDIADGALFENNTANKTGGAVSNWGGTFTIGKGASFVGNTAATNGGAIYQSSYYDSNSLMTVNSATFSGNHADGLGGAIYSEGNVILDATNGTIVFQNNTDRNGDNDIYLGLASDWNNGSKPSYSKGALTIEGNNGVEINSGIAGVAGTEITNNGKLVLGGDSSNYQGTFNQTQSSAVTEIINGAVFFGGTNNISGGEVNVSGTMGGTNNISGGEVNVSGTMGGTNKLTGGSVTLEDGSTLSGTTDIKGGSMTLKGGNDNTGAVITFKNAMSGFSRKARAVDSDTLVLDTTSKDLALDASVISEAGAAGTVNKTGSNTLNVNTDQNEFKGTFNNQDGTTTIDGSGKKFFGGTNNINNGTLNVRNGAELVANSTTKLNNSSSMKLDSNAIVAGDVEMSGTSAISINSDASTGSSSTVNITGAITGGGSITLNDGNLVIGENNDLSSYKGN